MDTDTCFHVYIINFWFYSPMEVDMTEWILVIFFQHFLYENFMGM
jgi:hypothetical protein